MRFLIKFRKSVMLFLKMLIVASVTLAFLSVWFYFYTDAMLYRNGNYLILFSFVLLFVVFSRTFGAFKIGIYRIHEVIYYFFISLLLTNFFTYLELSLIARYLLNPLPLLLVILYQLVAVSIGSYCANHVYFTLYKARRMLALFGDEEDFKLIHQMRSIPARFRIEQGVNANTISMEEIRRLIDKYESVIICNVDKNKEKEIILYCYENQKRTYLLPSITDVILNNSYAIQIGDIPVLMGRNRGLTTEQQIIKRMFDILLSSILLVLFAPLMLITAIAVKLHDGGPVLFRQNRVGKDGKIFNIYKFRSMVVGADRMGSNFTQENDSRITKVGRVIRTLRIDEFPQLFNVLRGNMSLVGPRPESVENVYKYSCRYPEFDLRHKVKSGLTGYAQVYGKSNTDPLNKLNMDLFYIETYSPLLDFKIMLLTVKTIFTKGSSEGFDSSQVSLPRNRE